MKSEILIYLAGTIKKGPEDMHESVWTDEDINFIKTKLHLYKVIILNPAFRSDDLSDYESTFGRDMLQVSSSDIVFVDARNRRGIGVGAEMMWAKINRIPIITWAPLNTHYNKINAKILDVDVDHFIHPFIGSLSDKIVDNLKEGAEWIENFIKHPSSISIKGFEHIHAFIQHYKKNQFHNDIPMRDLVNISKTLREKVQVNLNIKK